MHSSVIIIAMLFLLLNLEIQKYAQNLTVQTIIRIQKFMKTEERLAALAKLGDYIDAIDEAELDELVLKVRNENPWFTPGSINLALEGIRRYLDAAKMKKWISAYNVGPRPVKRIAVVMAGNIPLAG